MIPKPPALAQFRAETASVLPGGPAEGHLLALIGPQRPAQWDAASTLSTIANNHCVPFRVPASGKMQPLTQRCLRISGFGDPA
jgi:hypothetical protein